MTVVIIREDLIGHARDITPTMFNYKTHADNDSMYNTPPCYAIYICKLVLEWIKNEIGGLEKMKERNEGKAALLYDFLDSSKLFKGTVVKEDRSLMNIPFVTGSEELDAKFVKEAAAAGLRQPQGTAPWRVGAPPSTTPAGGRRGKAGRVHEGFREKQRLISGRSSEELQQ